MEPAVEFAMLQHGRRRRHLFRTVQLNALGWTAVAVVSVPASLVLAGIASALGWPAWVGALLGLPTVLVGLVALDRRRDRRAYVSFGWTEDEAVVLAAAGQLAHRGVPVTVEEDPPGLRFRRRDERLVRKMLGLPRR